MKFSQKSEYGVRLLVGLAQHDGEGPLPLSEIAREQGLSQSFLEQVIMPLRRGGIVQSQQGVRGGYVLSRSPQQITMGEVLRLLEGTMAPMFCVTEVAERDICAYEEHCGTRTLWARIRDVINAALDTLTLADLAESAPPAPLLTAGAAEGTVSYLTRLHALPVVAADAAQCADYHPATVSPQPAARA